MSKPILYKPDETSFNTLGIGVLNDAVSCVVTEERNGIFVLDLIYPVSGILFSEIELDRQIRCDSSPQLKKQIFRIVKISKPINQLCQIYAEHVSYLTEGLQLKPNVSVNNKTAAEALKLWAANIIIPHPFTVSSDIPTVTTTTWDLSGIENARKALGGAEGSILDRWNGEYRFNNYSIELLKNRGSDKGVVISYGKNLTDLNQEENITGTYTSLYPFSVYSDDKGEHLVTLDPPYYIDSPYVGNYSKRKIQKVDFSDKDIRTKSALKSAAESYIKSNEIGIPKVNLKLSYIDLSDTMEYQGKIMTEDIALCDIVTVYFQKLGVFASAKVIKTIWDVLLDRYQSIELGETKTNITTQLTQLKSVVSNVPTQVNIGNAIDSAIMDSTGNSGGNILFSPARNPEAVQVMDAYTQKDAMHVLKLDSGGLGHENRKTAKTEDVITIDGKVTGPVLIPSEDEMMINIGESDVDALDRIKGLSFLSYENTETGKREEIGLSTDALSDTTPELVEDANGTPAIRTKKLLLYALKAIQELEQKLSEKEGEENGEHPAGTS